MTGYWVPEDDPMDVPKPTPALLRAWATDFFDNPNASPPMVVDVTEYGWARTTPGFLLRLIADALERAEQT